MRLDKTDPRVERRVERHVAKRGQRHAAAPTDSRRVDDRSEQRATDATPSMRRRHVELVEVEIVTLRRQDREAGDGALFRDEHVDEVFRPEARQ